MSKKIVLDVGNCGPDHAAIKRLLTNTFDAEVLKTDSLGDTMRQLKETNVDLILINRKLDIDYSDGIEILKSIKADDALSSIPVMLITNYEEHQATAIEAGALRGFGKLELDKPETHDRLAAILD